MASLSCGEPVIGRFRRTNEVFYQLGKVSGSLISISTRWFSSGACLTLANQSLTMMSEQLWSI